MEWLEDSITMKKENEKNKDSYEKYKETHASGDAVLTRPTRIWLTRHNKEHTHLTQCRLPKTQTRFGRTARAINYESKKNHVQSMVVHHLSTAAEAILVT